MRLSSARGAEPHGCRNGIEACGGADGSPPKRGLDDVDGEVPRPRPPGSETARFTRDQARVTSSRRCRRATKAGASPRRLEAHAARPEQAPAAPDEAFALRRYRDIPV